MIHKLFSWPRPIRHRLTLYVAPEASRHENDGPKNPDSGEVLAALSRRDSGVAAQNLSLLSPQSLGLPQLHPPHTHTEICLVLPTAPGFYQEISLDELSAVELMGKLAELLALPANQIRRLFHQGPGGILILLSDQVSEPCQAPQGPRSLFHLRPRVLLSALTTSVWL